MPGREPSSPAPAAGKRTAAPVWGISARGLYNRLALRVEVRELCFLKALLQRADSMFKCKRAFGCGDGDEPQATHDHAAGKDAPFERRPIYVRKGDEAVFASGAGLPRATEVHDVSQAEGRAVAVVVRNGREQFDDGIAAPMGHQV